MIAVVAGLIVRDGKLLIAQRPGDKHMGGRWEFPGGKIEKGESPEAALRRELSEELGIEVKVGRIYHAVMHSYPEKDVLLMFYRCSLMSGEPRPSEEADVRWIKESEIRSYNWAEADIPAVQWIEHDGLDAICDI